ncbi:MAG: hypothetical protein ACK5QW_04390 [Cyanobacteriota bacterium]
MRIWILTADSLPATAAGGKDMKDDPGALLGWEKVATGTRMTIQATALAARALALLLDRGIETTAITGGRAYGISGAAALVLPQLDNIGGDFFQLSELMVF